MTEPGQIQWLSRRQVDTAKWDDCISRAGNGLIYAYSFYLDRMARQWDALVMGDYEAVMPLTWNRKFGICYLSQPFLTAQLGIFGKNPDIRMVDTFLKNIPAKFQYWDICLNHQNVFRLPDFYLYERMNYVLPLHTPYEYLQMGYRENTQRNIRKTMQAGCSVRTDFDVENLISLVLQQTNENRKKAEENVSRFRHLYRDLQTRNMSRTYGIFSLEGELLSAAVFFFSHQRAYYILAGSSPAGRNMGASHALVDAFIKAHAGKNLVLDFEGSDISGLAFFYSSFGAIEEKYTALRENRLPFYLRWMKK